MMAIVWMVMVVAIYVKQDLLVVLRHQLPTLQHVWMALWGRLKTNHEHWWVSVVHELPVTGVVLMDFL
jgi:hypothetical protein